MRIAEPPVADSHLPPARRFRVQDSAPALWLMTAVLLVAGYGALRLLTGASDTPQVDSPGVLAPSDPSASATNEHDDGLHKLRPQTPDDRGLDALHSTDSMFSSGERWQSLPGTTWDLGLPADPRDDRHETDMAAEEELLR